MWVRAHKRPETVTGGLGLTGQIGQVRPSGGNSPHPEVVGVRQAE
jgi:hypothetical protein